MRFISYRGFIYGQDEKINVINTLEKNYDVLIDCIKFENNNILFMDQIIQEDSLKKYKEKIWFISQDEETIQKLKLLEMRVDTQLEKNILFLPEENYEGSIDYDKYDTICSSFIGWYKQKYNSSYKIALCISGRLSTHKKNLNPQIKNYLLKNPTHWIDVYMSLNYDLDSKSFYKELDIPFVKKVSCKKFVMSSDTAKYKKRPDIGHAPLFNILSYFYHRREVIKLVPEQTECVIMYRSDLITEIPDVKSIFIPVINKDFKCFVAHGHEWFGVTAHTHMGNMKTIKIFASLDPDDYLDYNYHPESLLKYHADKKNIEIVVYHLDIILDPERRNDTFDPYSTAYW
jgi:hypothetical protein